MKHLKMHSVDGVAQNVERIAALFPNCVTERKGENGEVERAIDFDLLRQELSRDIIDSGEERYQFTWPDKRKAIRLANSPISATLRPVRDDSVDFDNTQNLYIEGDNLDVLKLLRETYLGKVKMIYIDPPYNTGNDFVYEDDFSQAAGDYLANSGQYDEQGNRLVANTESNGRFHTDWLNMVYPRLKVARDLLADDGVIFISIDDNEVDNLKRICNEVFGESNFVATIPWRKRTAKSDVPFGISQDYEWVVVYAKSNDFFASVEGKERKYYTTPDFPNRPWRVHDLTKQTTASERPNSFFTIVNPKTGEKYPANPNATWRITEDTFPTYLAENRIVFPGDYSFLRISKPVLRYWKEDDMKKTGDSFGRIAVSTKLPDDIGMSQDGTKEATNIFNGKIFSFPKPSSLIKFFIKIIHDEEALILDFFSGSATTAHAVMQQNAEDGGNRKFIMVQLPEETDDKSEAHKAGYGNICEIGKDRIRRAGKKIITELEQKRDALSHEIDRMLYARPSATAQLLLKEDLEEIAENVYKEQILPKQKELKKIEEHLARLDIGFRVLRLDSSNMEDVFYTPDKFDPNTLTGLLDNVKPDRSDEDLLFQIMLELDIPLSASVKVEQIAGKRVFNVSDGHLIATFDKDVNESTVTDIARRKPNFFVMRDASAANDNVLDNFEQIFRHYSPDIIYKIL